VIVAKAVIFGLISGLGVLASVLVGSGITAADWVAVAIATLTTVAGTLWDPSKPAVATVGKHEAGAR
jgi:hypothetical protein